MSRPHQVPGLLDDLMARAEGYPAAPMEQEAIPVERKVCGPYRLPIMPQLRTFNVKEGLASLEEARKLVIEEIRRAKGSGIRVLKVKRADGEYLVFVEEDYKAKVLLYRWKP